MTLGFSFICYRKICYRNKEALSCQPLLLYKTIGKQAQHDSSPGPAAPASFFFQALLVKSFSLAHSALFRLQQSRWQFRGRKEIFIPA